MKKHTTMNFVPILLASVLSGFALSRKRMSKSFLIVFLCSLLDHFFTMFTFFGGERLPLGKKGKLKNHIAFRGILQSVDFREGNMLQSLNSFTKGLAK